MRRIGQDRPQPRIIGRRIQRQPRAIDAVQLTTQPIGEPLFLVLEFLEDPGPFPQLNHPRVVGLNPLKCATIGPQPIGDRPCIAPIILRAARGKPIAEPIELFRIYGKHRKPVLEEGIHERVIDFA